MKFYKFSYSILFLLLVISSCVNDDISQKMDKLAPSTIALGELFYEKIKSEQFDSVCSMFSYSLYSDYTETELKDKLVYIYNKNGNIVDYEFLNTSFKTTNTNGDIVHTIINDYKVYYTSGYVSKEQLMYEVSLDTKKIEKIDAFRFTKYTP